MDIRCQNCFLKTYNHLFGKFAVKESLQQQFLNYLDELLIQNRHLSSPEIQRLLSHEFCKLIDISNPYFEEKRLSNQIALELYSNWKNDMSVNNFDKALRLAIAGNIMDYGANNSFDIDSTIENVLNASFAIDHSKLLQKAIEGAENILYLGDNAGEIVFDRLFIETALRSNNVTYVVKDSPVLNDVTIDDAKDVYMTEVANVISNGYDAPSTVLSKCSDEFRRIYNKADVVISKGQGNFEGLLNENDSRLYFLLMVKCDVIADMLNVRNGSFIVYNSNLHS